MRNLVSIAFILLFVSGWSTRDNNISVGDGAASDKTLSANKGSGATNPKVRFNNGSSLWDFSNDGSAYAPIVGTSFSQVLTNKTLSGNTATNLISGSGTLTLNTSGTITVPNGTDTLVGKATNDILTNKTLTTPVITSGELDTPNVDDYLDINEESAPSTPSSGKVRVYAKSDNKLYYLNDLGVETEVGGGGGGGSGEINAIPSTSSSSATDWAASGAGITVATTTTSGELPLNGVIANGIKIDPVSSTDYVYFRFTMPEALKNKKLKWEWHQRYESGYAAGDLKAEVYKNSASDYSGSYTEFDLSTDASGTSAVPAQNGKFTTIFDSDSGDYFEIRYVRTAGTNFMVFQNVIVGPNTQPQGAVVGTEASYTPNASVNQGLGTLASVDLKWVRVGEFMHIQGRFATGTVTGSELRLALPDGHTIASSYSNNTGVGYLFRNRSDATVTKKLTMVAIAGNAYLSVGSDDYTTNLAPLSNLNASSVVGTGETLSIEARVRIAQWVGGGTVNLAQNDVEYASVAGTWDADSSTTVYGPQGTLTGGTLAAAREKTITWSTPVQASDRIQVWASKDQVNWVPINDAQIGSSNSNVLKTINAAGTVVSGVSIRPGSTATQSIVVFGQYVNIANDDSPTVDWPSSASYWVATKSKAGQAVGFGNVSQTASGLMPASHANLDNAAATRLGLKAYYHGTNYNGGVAPTISGAANLVNIRSFFIPKQMQDGTWMVDATVVFSLDSGSRSSYGVTVNGVVTKNVSSFLQAGGGTGSGDIVVGVRSAANSAVFTIIHASATTDAYRVHFNFECESKPTWAY